MTHALRAPVFKNRVVQWIDYRLPIFTFMRHQLDEYPTPKNLSYWWNFGSLAGITLVIMILRALRSPCTTCLRPVLPSTASSTSCAM